MAVANVLIFTDTTLENLVGFNYWEEANYNSCM